MDSPHPQPCPRPGGKGFLAQLPPTSGCLGREQHLGRPPGWLLQEGQD